MPDWTDGRPERGLKQVSEMLINIILLGFFWTLTSLGIVTIGASTAALNDSMRACLEEEEKHPVKAFFRAFREYFGIATRVWLCHLVIIVVLVLDLLYYSAGSSTGDTLGLVAILTLLTVLVFEMSVVFACIVQYRLATVQACFAKAVDVAFRCFAESLQMVFITAAVIITGGILLHGILPFAAGIIAFADWKILPEMFRKYHFKKPVK